MNPNDPTPDSEETPPDSSGSGIDFRQLGLFSIIVAELTVLPTVFGGGLYLLTRDRDPLGISWQVWTGIGAAIGFGIAFYRIFLLTKQKKHGK